MIASTLCLRSLSVSAGARAVKSSAGLLLSPRLVMLLPLLAQWTLAVEARHPQVTNPSSGSNTVQNSFQSSLQSALTSFSSPTAPTFSTTLAATTRFFAAVQSRAATAASFVESATNGCGRCSLAACAPGDVGLWTAPGSTCTAYYGCAGSRRPVHFRTCSPGTVFYPDQQDCLAPQPGWRCWEPVCAGRPDGLYPDWSTNCRRSVRCQGGRVVAAIGCPVGTLSAGRAGCKPQHQVNCPSPSEGAAPLSAPTGITTRPLSSFSVSTHPACWNNSPSLMQDRSSSSKCRRYFRCTSSGQRVVETCPGAQVFDGSRCVEPDQYSCPGDSSAPCDRYSDGVHIQPGSRCKAYFRCSQGYKAIYLCSGDSIFDGERCVPSSQASCSEDANSDPDANICKGKSHGYFADRSSGCQRYVYCLTEARVASFTCDSGRRFDGSACVKADFCPGSQNHLQQQRQQQRQQPQQGFVQDLATGCRNYSFFIGGHETKLSCPPQFLFNGQVCVSETTYSCPTG